MVWRKMRPHDGPEIFTVDAKTWIHPISRRLSLRPQPTTKQPYAALISPLMVSIPVITWITTHLPTQEGWKTELAWLVDP